MSLQDWRTVPRFVGGMIGWTQWRSRWLAPYFRTELEIWRDQVKSHWYGADMR